MNMVIAGPAVVPVSLSHWGVFELSGSDVLRVIKSKQRAEYEPRYNLGKKAC